MFLTAVQARGGRRGGFHGGSQTGPAWEEKFSCFGSFQTQRLIRGEDGWQVWLHPFLLAASKTRSPEDGKKTGQRREGGLRMTVYQAPAGTLRLISP